MLKVGHANRHRSLLCLATLSIMTATMPTWGYTEMPMPLPESIESGRCYPINLRGEEMEKLWRLHYKYSKRMKPNTALVEAERNSLSTHGLIPERVECYTGSERFAALCFTDSRTKSLDIKVIKIMHSQSWSDCLSLTTAIKK